jgi:hypothetical protein
MVIPMNRFAARRWERIRDQSRELLARKIETYIPPLHRSPRDEVFVPEYVEPARLDTAPPAPAASIDWRAIETLIDRKINAAIATTRENLFAAAEAIAEQVAAIRESIEDRVDGETRELKIQMSALSSALGDLRAMIAADAERRAETIDKLMPRPSRRSDMN